MYSSPRTAESHRAVVRTRLGVTRNPGKARKIADRAIRKAAWVKNNPPDLINVALEHLVQASLELPAFSTLDEMATRIRAEINAGIFQMIRSRLGTAGRARLEALLVVCPDGKSDLWRLKRPARRASWSRFKEQRRHLEWVVVRNRRSSRRPGHRADSSGPSGYRGAARPVPRSAAFLTALHRPASEQAPAGRGRGGPLADYSEGFAKQLASAAEHASGGRARRGHGRGRQRATRSGTTAPVDEPGFGQRNIGQGRPSRRRRRPGRRRRNRAGGGGAHRDVHDLAFDAHLPDRRRGVRRLLPDQVDAGDLLDDGMLDLIIAVDDHTLLREAVCDILRAEAAGPRRRGVLRGDHATPGAARPASPASGRTGPRGELFAGDALVQV